MQLVAFGLNGRNAVSVVVGIAALVAPAIANIAEAPLSKTQAQNVAPSAATTEFEVASIRLNIEDRLPPINVVTRTVLTRAASAARNGRFTMNGIAATPLTPAARRVQRDQQQGPPLEAKVSVPQIREVLHEPARTPVHAPAASGAAARRFRQRDE